MSESIAQNSKGKQQLFWEFKNFQITYISKPCCSIWEVWVEWHTDFRRKSNNVKHEIPKCLNFLATVNREAVPGANQWHGEIASNREAIPGASDIDWRDSIPSVTLTGEIASNQWHWLER